MTQGKLNFNPFHGYVYIVSKSYINNLDNVLIK